MLKLVSLQNPAITLCVPLKILKRYFSVLKPLEADKFTGNSTITATLMEGRQLPLGASNYTGEINQTFCEKKIICTVSKQILTNYI